MLLVCSHCYAPLALDQRYCVECGDRARALPAPGPAATDPRVPTAVAVPTDPAPASGWLAWPAGWIPAPRAAAVAVMGMLAFGAELGAAVGASPPSAATSTVVVNRPAGQPAPLAAAAAGAASAQTVQTETITTGGASSGGGQSAAPAVASAPASAPAAPPPTTPAATTPTGPATNAYGLPEIKHVFLIMLGNAGFSQTFNSQDPYFGHALAKQGKLLQFYYGVTGGELANEIALFSGQGPTNDTAANCATYNPFTVTGHGKDGQVLGSGCVYPKQVPTLGSQLTAAHLSWKAYIQGQADGLPGHPQACVHPTLGQPDPSQAPSSTSAYVTWRNPFVYFQSIAGAPSCAKQDADFSQLSTDLTTEPTTPNLSVIVTNPCDDGSAEPCRPGGVGGPGPAGAFLKTTLSEIEASPAYLAGGLIIITGDQAPQSGTNADPSACCSTPTYPNLSSPPAAPQTTSTSSSTTAPSAGAGSSTETIATTGASLPVPVTTPNTTTPLPAAGTTSATDTTASPTSTSGTSTPAPGGPTTSGSTTTSTTAPPDLGSGGQTTPTGGGGQVGLLLISPWVKKGTDDPLDYYNHFSLLKSLEEIFAIKQRLGYAGLPGLPAFNAATFDGTGPTGG